MNATTGQAGPAVRVQTTPWPGFKYVPVERYSLPNRKLMRKARKNMRAILAARAGNHEIAALLVRMEHIRRSSRADFGQKLRYFLEVERDYINIVTRAQTAAAPKTSDQQAGGVPDVDLRDETAGGRATDGDRAVDDGGIPPVEATDAGVL